MNAAVRPGRRIGEPDLREQSGQLDERGSQLGAHPRHRRIRPAAVPDAAGASAADEPALGREPRRPARGVHATVDEDVGHVPARDLLAYVEPGSDVAVGPPSASSCVTAAVTADAEGGCARPGRTDTVGDVLRVQLLGDITAFRDGRPVPLSAPHRRLLAFLALHPGPHQRDALAARFWPDVPDPRANLRTAVWVLRRSLGDDAVIATRTSVALGPVTRDLDDTETLERDEPGQPCAGIDDDWAEAARAEHLRRRIARLDGVAAATDDPAEAARWSARRCALTPLDEPAHRALVERLVAAGDRAGALVVGRELAERLRAELGVDPAPATRALLARLRRPAAASSAPAGVGTPMFGRATELAALTAAWTAARDGRGRVVLVTGEAGIGKTRLVAELARRADNAGARVAVGAGVDVGGEAPLAVWQELARALVGVVPPPPERAGWPAELGRLAPDLAGALGCRVVPPVVASPELERLRLFDAVLRLVEWAAAGRPVLLVAEDVHRADRASLALCAHIGRRLAALPVLFVLTRRDRPARPDADALLADLAGRGLDVTEIEPGPLRPAEVAEVVRSVATLPDAMVSQVVVAADGNPLLAVESARAVAAGSSAPPPSLRAVVRAALGTLPEPARALAEAIAAAGRGLAAPEVAALAGHRRGGTPGARHRPRPPGQRRAGVPARPARRGRAGRPARSGGHPPGRRAGRRGGRGGRGRARRRGGAAPPAGRPRRPGGAPLAAGRAARPLARRAAGGHRVLDRGAALRPGRHLRAARARRGARLVRTDPGLRAGVGDRRWPGSHPPTRPQRGAAAGCSSGPSPATRPSPSPPTAGPRSCSPGTRPPRCGPRC